jgi:O-antigen/teichoic acid export membrane protein
MMVQQVVTWASSIVLMLFLPRYLGPVEYGRLFLALAMVEIFRIFVAYGGNYLIPKLISRNKEETAQIVSDSVALRIVIAILSLGAMLGVSLIIGYSPEVQVLMLILGISLIFLSGSTVLYAAYQGHELMQYTSFGAIAERVSVSVLAVIALLLGARSEVVAGIMTLGISLNLAALYLGRKRIFIRLPGVRWREISVQLKSALPYFLLTVFSVVYYRISSLMLAKMATDEVVGWFGAAFRFFDSLNFLPYIFTMAIYPVLSRLWVEHGDTHRRTTVKSLEFVILAGVPMSVGIYAFSPQVVNIFYTTAAYGPSVDVLKALSFGLLLMYVDMVLATTLMSSDRQKQQSFIALGAIPLSIGLNYVLIPYYQNLSGNGGIGSALSTVLTEAVILMTLLSVMPKGSLSGFRFGMLVKTFGAGACMAGAIWGLDSLGVEWVLRGILGSAVYLLLILGTKVLGPGEMSLLRELFSKGGIMKFARFLRPAA